MKLLLDMHIFLWLINSDNRLTVPVRDAIHVPLEIMNAAAELNADFLTIRSVESVEGVPAHLYNCETAIIHLNGAKANLELVRGWMEQA